MPKFNAATAVEPLEYDFRPHVECDGTVPEPTDSQVASFYADLANSFRDALGPERVNGVDWTDPSDVGELYQSITAEDNLKLYDRQLDVHAAVCGGSPSREQLEALPFQLRRVFYGMVQEWLRPEAETPATSS